MRYRMSVAAMLAALLAMAALSAPQPAEASGPAMALGATGNVLCDDPVRPTRCLAEFNPDDPAAAQFTITVDATVIPQGGYTGFASEVVFDGLTYVQRAVCTDEVVWPAGSGGPCFRFLARGGQAQHGGISDIIPPYDVSNFTGTFVELDMRCADIGSNEVLLTALPSSSFGAGYFDQDGEVVLVKTLGTRNLDLDGLPGIDPTFEHLDGDVIPDLIVDPDTGKPVPREYALADLLEIECVAGALPTPTPCPPEGCPTPTFTPTPTPCLPEGCPTATPRPTPRSFSIPARPSAPKQLSPPFGQGGPLAVGGGPDGLPIAGSSAVAGGGDWLLIAILASMAVAALVAGAGAALYLRDER
jgi:hypothetical protein